MSVASGWFRFITRYDISTIKCSSTNLVSNVWTNSDYIELPEPGIIDVDFESVTNAVPILGDQGFIRLRME